MSSIIHSRANPAFRDLLRLAQNARFRKEIQRTLIEGIHLTRAYWQRYSCPEVLVVSETGLQQAEIAELLQEKAEEVAKKKLVIFTDALFSELSSLPSPAGILGIITVPQFDIFGKLENVLVLVEGIQDPGNLGTLMRTAAAAGVKQVFLSKTTVHPWSPKVLRSAQGAHFYLDIFPESSLDKVIARFRAQLHPARSLVAALVVKGGQSVYHSCLAGPLAIILGNEGEGVSASLRAQADTLITIPMPGGVESLNVAIAGAICLFERVRQLTTS